MPGERLTAKQTAIAAWGALGFGALLVRAIVALTPLALAPIRERLMSPLQIALYAVWTLWMAWTEGYKTFQKLVAPRVVARAIHLARHPRLLHVLLAPPFCMALFHATRRRMIVAWSVVTMIVALIVSVHFLPQPWRGIVDGGVVVGLTWGLVALLVCFGLALTGRPMAGDPDLPAAVAAERPR